jgi:lysophospholipase L1-like esterase
MMIGTNNIGISGEEEILAGIENIVSAVRVRRPEAKITLIGIFPRANCEALVARLNVGIANVAKKMGVNFRDPGKAMLKEDGTIEPSLFVDGLHPSVEGYERVVKGFIEK